MKKYVDIVQVCEIMGNLFGIPYEFDRPITMDDVSESIDEIKTLPTTDVVERSKIDKAIEEMMHYYDGFVMFGRRDLAYAVDNCIKMLDKAINEVSE